MIDPAHPGDAAVTFLTEYHLATLTTLRPDGSPHVVAIGFTYEPNTQTARVITFAGAVKARNAARGGRAALCQVDGARWLTLEGTVSLVTDPEGVSAAVARYATRYRQPRERNDRVAIEIAVDRILGRA